MLPNDNLYFGHMLDTAVMIVSRLHGVDREEFDGDEDLRLALTYLIQMFGEAANRVSPEGRLAYPQIPWREAIATRHRIVHDYLNVDVNAVWEIAVMDMPDMVEILRPIVPD